MRLDLWIYSPFALVTDNRIFKQDFGNAVTLRTCLKSKACRIAAGKCGTLA